MRVNRKGQVTIPREIRDRLGIGPGAEVAFVAKSSHVELIAQGGSQHPPGRREQIEAALARHAGTLETSGLDGQCYVDWIRGRRDDVLPD